MSALSLTEIKTLSTVDFDKYEIRAAKYGILNAQSTGPLYVDGQYIPASCKLDCSGNFSDTTVKGIGFYPPYDGTFNALDFIAGDLILIDGSNLSVASTIDATSLTLSVAPAFSGTSDFTATWTYREYLIEPDVGKNTVTGNAHFTQGSVSVTSLSPFSDLTGGDFIKADSFQKNYIIDTVSGTSLTLTAPYDSLTTAGYEPYTAKRRQLNRMYVEYVKDDFRYEKNGGVWVKNDGTTGSVIATDYYSPLTDGIQVKFTKALSSTDPDLMDTAVVLGKTFAQKTQREMPQFPLPVVPYPESSLKLYINTVEQDRFPVGNRNYVVSYSQDPIYVSPPDPANRKVANLMFLQSTGTQTLQPSVTASGAINFVDPAGNGYSGIMPKSESLWFNGAIQDRYVDYVFDYDAGIAYATSSKINEKIVGSIFIDKSDLIDYGIEFTLKGSRLKYSVPPKTTDDVLLSLESGRFKPASKDHPAPDEEYMIDYLVDANYVDKESVIALDGLTSFRTKLFPIKTNSVILSKNGIVLEETTDFRVDYQTGRIVLTTALVKTDQVSVNYAPLSFRRNGMTYADGVSYCTSYESPLSIKSASTFNFALSNSNLPASDATFLKIYNLTRNKNYDLSGISMDANSVTLAKNSNNSTIGLSPSDYILADYKFAAEETEYAPIIVNNFVVPQNSTAIHLPAVDAASFFSPGSVVRLTPSDAAKDYHFIVSGSSYDGEDTNVDFSPMTIPEDIVNPSILVTDSSVIFLPTVNSTNVVSGSNTILLPSVDIPNLFRPGSLTQIGTQDIYTVSGATFNRTGTEISLSSGVFKDYTPSMIWVSETPVYAEGSTTIIPAEKVITEPAQPVMTLSYLGTGHVTTDPVSLSFITDSSTYIYPYSTWPSINDMSSGLSSIPWLSVVVYQPLWQSSKINPNTLLFVGPDSSTLLTAGPALRVDGTDSTAFSVVDGEINLTDGLVRYQRMYLDYQGLKYLSDTTVSFLADYFVNLPANSNVQASFQFTNLDQFYVQVVSRRWFLDNVTQPRVKQEAAQQNGNVGQGGEVPDDSDSATYSGGLTNDEYRRQDTEIECRVFKAIFDAFNKRLQAISDERENAIGYKICNNDGLISASDESCAIKSFSRMFPLTDYTGMAPLPITPLTGQVHGPGLAVFNYGSTAVTGIGTNWLQQIQTSDGTYYIRPSDTTTDYAVQQVLGPTSLVLNQSFAGTSSPGSGGSFTLTSPYPLFDDDGFCGAKIAGTSTGNFGLSDGDTFDMTAFSSIDTTGTLKTCTFLDPTDPIGLLFYPLSSYSVGSAASALTAAFSGYAKATAEWVFDPTTPYGYKTVIVLRTDGIYNKVILGHSTSQAITKLGFVPDTTAWGNIDRTDSGSECVWDLKERNDLSTEKSTLDSIINNYGQGVYPYPTKLDRTNASELALLPPLWAAQMTDMTNEQLRLNKEIAAASYLALETYPAYSDTTTKALISVSKAQKFQTDTSYEMARVGSLVGTWDGYGNSSNWVLDYSSSRQYIRGVYTASGVGTDQSSGIGITSITDASKFILQDSSMYDTRILNTPPVARFENDHSLVTGAWSGWDMSPSPVNGRYSLTNEITFNFVTSSAFTIYDDGTPTNPIYTVTGNDLRLRWLKSSGYQTPSFSFSSYPTIQSLTSAISAMDGFGVTPLYDGSYSTLALDSSHAVPVFPGSTVYIGSGLPVFEISFHPIYQVTPSSLILNDATISLSTIGALATSISSVAGFQMAGAYSPGYPATGLLPASGDASTWFPGTRLFFTTPPAPFGIRASSADASYSVSATSMTVHWKNGATVMSKTLSFSSYPTLLELVNGIDVESGIDATTLVDRPSYNYVALNPVGTAPISDASYSPVYLGAGSPAVEFYYTGNPGYIDDSTAFEVITPTTAIPFQYITYPTIGALTTAIEAISGISITTLVDPDTTYIDLQNGLGYIGGIDRTITALKATIFSATEPYDMTNGDQVAFRIDGGVDQTATFRQTNYINPGDNIQNIVNANPAGTTYVLRSGVHRMQKVVPHHGDTFIGETGAIMNGSLVIPDWTSTGGKYRHTFTSPLTMGLRNGAAVGYDVATSILNGFPCIYPEQLFLYDSTTATQLVLTRVQHLSDVISSGTWYTDYTNIYTYDDWRDARYTTELGQTQFAFGYDATAGQYFPDHTYGNPMPTSPALAPNIYSLTDQYYYKPRGVTIKNIIVEKYANPAQTGAIGYHRPGLDWTVEDCEVRWCHGNGIKFRGRALINGNYVHHNGIEGIGCGDGNRIQADGGDLLEWGFYGGYSGYDATIINNECSYNLLPEVGINPDWEGGGGKFSQAFYLYANNNYYHDNYGRGFWSDFSYDGALYSNNRIENNYKEGIMIEITQSATEIKCNTLKNNSAFVTGSDVWGGQITISNSTDVHVHDNYLVVNASYGNGVTIADYSWRNVEGNDVFGYGANVQNNHITFLGTGPATVNINTGQTDRDPATFFSTATNKFTGNAYHVANLSGQYFRWDIAPFNPYPPYLNWTQWHTTYGQDTTGTIDTNTGFVPTLPCSGYIPYVPPVYTDPIPLSNIHRVTAVEAATIIGSAVTGMDSTNMSGYVKFQTVSALGPPSSIRVMGGAAVPELGLSVGTVTGSIFPYTPFNTINLGASIPAFNIYWDMSNRRYRVDGTSMTVSWNVGSKELLYSTYTNIGLLKAGIINVTGFGAYGPSSYDSYAPSLVMADSTVPDVIYFTSALRSLYVDYQTISDANLADRTGDISRRDSTLVDRLGYLLGTRDYELSSAVPLEQFFRASEGGYGNLYPWADNRFNRRQGCNARLNQIEKQIESNQSGLTVNKRLI